MSSGYGVRFRVEGFGSHEREPRGRMGGVAVVPRQATVPPLLDTIYLLVRFRKSTPPQNRQLHIRIDSSQ